MEILQNSVLIPMSDSVLPFHSFVGERIKGIVRKFGDYTKLTRVTNT